MRVYPSRSTFYDISGWENDKSLYIITYYVFSRQNPFYGNNDSLFWWAFVLEIQNLTYLFFHMMHTNQLKLNLTVHHISPLHNCYKEAVHVFV